MLPALGLLFSTTPNSDVPFFAGSTPNSDVPTPSQGQTEFQLFQTVSGVTGPHPGRSFVKIDLQPGMNFGMNPTTVISGTTNDMVCAYARHEDGHDVEECLPEGTGNLGWAANDYERVISINGKLQEHLPVYLRIFGGDALWVDTFQVAWLAPLGWGSSYFDRTFGTSDNHGYCMSTDPSDQYGWEANFSSKPVTAGACVPVRRFCPCGSSEGFTSTGNSFTEIHGCYANTEAACREAAELAGFEIGGAGWNFAGNYGTKGCYAYEKNSSSDYAGRAYFGTLSGGATASVSEMQADVASPKFRPLRNDCACSACSGRRRLVEEEGSSTDAIRLLKAEADA